MRRRVPLAIGTCVVAFLLFFFFVPIVWTNIDPYSPGSYGYTSLSFHFSMAGETYFNGQFQLSTPAEFVHTTVAARGATP
ncbi:MAG: hypothetical protein ACLP9K_09750 [Nitrososphaerales archaeon]|jgi:hypothetical protein